MDVTFATRNLFAAVCVVLLSGCGADDTRDPLGQPSVPDSLAYADVGMRELRQAAGEGKAAAQYELGRRNAVGKDIPHDYSEAANWYRRAAEQGHALAQCELGFLYATGKGLPQNDEEAVAWFRRSAEQGYAKAQFNLAFMYHNDRVGGGESILVNREKFDTMLSWYRKAAEQGYPPAMSNLGNLLIDGPSEYRAEGEMWLRRYQAAR